MGPWMQSIIVNLDFPLGMELPGMEAISSIRGRLIPRQSMVMDEAQNLTPHALKTIVARVSQGTKNVLRDGRRQRRPAA